MDILFLETILNLKILTLLFRIHIVFWNPVGFQNIWFMIYVVFKGDFI